MDFSIYEFELEGNNLALFRIDATINTPVSFKGISYIRVGSYKKLLHDHPEKQRKIWANTNRRAFEKEIALSSASLNDVFELINCNSYFELMEVSTPTNDKFITEKLIDEKIIVRQGDIYDITNIGAILFARDIRKFEDLDRKAVRVIFYKGDDRIEAFTEQVVGQKGYASGFNGLIRYITDRLPSSEEIGKAFRKEVSIYPPIAIRELVANAIIHQDFSIGGISPMVEIFSNRIEITNSGKPLIDTLRFIDHSPESRNEMLAGYMRRLKICEERGSGIDKVVCSM